MSYVVISTLITLSTLIAFVVGVDIPLYGVLFAFAVCAADQFASVVDLFRGRNHLTDDWVSLLHTFLQLGGSCYFGVELAARMGQF